MFPSDAAWGIPDFGEMLNRARVTERIAQSGDKPCVLFGPSGCGKSVAASQYAGAGARLTVWVDAGGEFISANQLAIAVLRALDKGLPDGSFSSCDEDLALVDSVDAIVRGLQLRRDGADGVLIVVDDLGSPSSSQAAADFKVLSRGLWRCSSKLLVTCRTVADWSGDTLCESVLLGPAELAFTQEEADELLEHSGNSALLARGNEIRSACNGHPAFFVVMASQANEYGLDSGDARTPSLEAWLRNAVTRQLSTSERKALVTAALLRTGSDADMRLLRVKHPVECLDRLAGCIPLVTCSRTVDGGRAFRIHQLVDGFLVDGHFPERVATDSRLLDDAISLLSARGDYSRAAEILAREGGPDSAVDWLVEHGDAALANGHYTALSRLIDRAPVAALMAEPRLLLVWAEVCAQTGHLGDAFAKCRAARTLAEHAGSTEVAYRALALCARYAGRANRIDEAEELTREILSVPRGRVPSEVRAEALLCRAQNATTRGEYALATELLEDVLGVSSTGTDGTQIARSASHALSLIPALALGDYLATSRMLAPGIIEGGLCLTDRVMLKGNVAACLCEAGRLARCEQLLRSALSESHPAGLEVYSGAYLAVLGCAQVGLGMSSDGVETIVQGIALSLAGGDEQGADQSRVYLSVVLRTVGEPSEALVVAERAYERFAQTDSFGFRRLAALEVAASLLALGDSSAAAAWAGAVVDEGFAGNQHHELRAVMILAEVDRRRGRVDEAAARLGSLSNYILSENANWQVAMYCRAFPGLMGVFALALGVDALPAHMLRMIPPEGAERVLEVSQPLLAKELWVELGDRLLGAPEMSRYCARNGLPLCHVRLFGGLEVAVGGRIIDERGWRKRKARLLFAMIASKRGQDVPRDQVVEHLWPEMDADRARNNLYVAWSTMKSVLGAHQEKGTPCPYIESVGGVCRTVRETVRLDLEEFEELLIAARNCESEGRVREALAAYEKMANLYRGDLLPGDLYDDWFASLRDYYRSEFVDAMLRASRLLLTAADPGNALVYVRRAIQVDSLREDLYQRALECQIAAGQRSSAIDTYLQCRVKLSEELGLDPSVETRLLYDQVLAMENRPIAVPLDPLSEPSW